MTNSRFRILLVCVLLYPFVSCANEKREIEYYPEGMKKMVVTNYANENKTCVEKFFPNGRLEDEFCLIDESIEGQRKAYYLDGKVRAISNYKNGQLNGEVIFYHPNGQIENQSKYLNGVLEGQILMYYADGRLKAENYVAKDFIHYIKEMKYDSLNELDTILKDYIPKVSLNSDVIEYYDTLIVDFDLPIPLEYFPSKPLRLYYDFLQFDNNQVDTTLIPYPRFDIAFDSTHVQQAFLMEDIGTSVFYGFLSLGGGNDFKSFKKMITLKGPM